MSLRNTNKISFVKQTGLLAILVIAPLILIMPSPSAADSFGSENAKQLLWGDTHLHTSYSFDAFLTRNQSADPDTAYRWAKGKPVIHPYSRARVQIQTPLDFLVVADHAEAMGVMRAINRDIFDTSYMGPWDWIKSQVAMIGIKLAGSSEKYGAILFGSLIPKPAENPGTDPVKDPANYIATGLIGDTVPNERQAWSEIVDAAEAHNEPGKFTSLIGWEWSSVPTGANLHRVVFTPDGADKAKQFLPYGSDQSQYPEDLWSWLEDTEKETGARFIAIPHNSNISKGYMFAETTLKDKPITAEYAKRRLSWEPIVEITQIKGDSETHPELSPKDEFSDFETYDFYIQQSPETPKVHKGDYVRAALKTGLSIEESVGANPYKFGVIGSTDAHTGMASAEENNFWGKLALDSIPENKNGHGKIGRSGGPTGWNMAAQGLAAVWAKENTREEIYAAFKRKEVYGSTGPRISLRLFAGWGFEEGAENAEDISVPGYSQGVPMGGDLTRNEKGKAPQLLIRTVKDPVGANLDRVQVIKGWVDEAGEQNERVYNVDWSGKGLDKGRALDEQGKLPPVGNTIDMKVPSYKNTIGATEFSTIWQDPDFNPNERSFYYVRVIEIPTPRHSLFDAVALQQELPESIAKIIQERAYSSPVWYTP